MLGHFIKHQILMQERQESDLRLSTLCKLPANTFAAIYAECDPVWAGARYNGVYYSELEIYAASQKRDEGYEDFLWAGEITMDSDDYQLTDEDFESIKASIESGFVEMPAWVKTADDFDRWLEEVNHG